MCHEKRVTVLELALLRVEERRERLATKRLVVREVAVPQVEIVAEERGQRACEEHVVAAHALGQRSGAVDDVVEQRELPKAERATEQDGERHLRGRRQMRESCRAADLRNVRGRENGHRPFLLTDQLLDLWMVGENLAAATEMPLGG